MTVFELKGWDELLHPRGPGGQFAPKGSAEARQAREDADKEKVEAAAASDKGDVVVTVKSGDTLYELAEKFYGDGERWREIAKANGVEDADPRKMPVGIKLTIPGPVKTTDGADKASLSEGQSGKDPGKGKGGGKERASRRRKPPAKAEPRGEKPKDKLAEDRPRKSHPGSTAMTRRPFSVKGSLPPVADAPPAVGLEHKALSGTGCKVLDDGAGIVEAIVSVTGYRDEVKDVIEPGAYEKTLTMRRPKGVSGHDWQKPVAKALEVTELGPGDSRLPTHTNHGAPWPSEAGALKVLSAYNLDTQLGRDTYSNVKFYGPEQEWCADEQTEILTDRGWLRYDELTTDDRAYTLDPDYSCGQFEPVLAVNVWPERERMLRRIETGGHSSLTTAAHRWPTVSNRDGGRMTWTTTEQLDYRDGLLRAAGRADTPDTPKYADALVELVGWFWTEGWVPPADHSDAGLYLAQSVERNPQHAASIRAALDAAVPGQWSEAHSKDGMARFRVRREAARAVLDVTGPDKEPTAAFLTSLTRSQLTLLIETCLAGDGTRSKGGQRTWFQVADAGVRAFEMLCALAGQPTVTTPQADYGNRHGRPPQRVSLLRSGVTRPLDAIRVKGYGYKTGPTRTPAVDVWEKHTGIVWCPTTRSGTWLARRRGTVYFTGNSIGYNVPRGGAVQDHKSQTRYIKGIDLYEWSDVLFGAMPLAGTQSVKGLLVGAAPELTLDIKALPGSLEERQQQLEAALWRDLLGDPDSDESGRGWVKVLGTYDDHVVVQQWGPRTEGEKQAWRYGYKAVDGGVLLGTREPVQLTEHVTVVPTRPATVHGEDLVPLSPEELAETDELWSAVR